MAESENQLFAGYEILATLGQGGMGTVFKARHQMLHRVVALKVLSPHLANDPDYITRFKREAIAAANLSHPNLVRVFEAGEHEGVHYFAMEFVEGESLDKKLEREGRLGAQEAIAICRQVAEALDYAWQKGKVIHRDIKPDNIFLGQDGQAKVGDLGLAKRPREPGSSASLTQTGMMVGTPHYISPEQARGQKEMDFRADIYSLGCTLYRMLSGQTPYQSEDALGVVLQHVNNPPPDILKVVRDCPRPVVALLARMMGKVPAMRHGSYYELITELKRVEQQLKAGVGTVPRVVGRASWFQSWPVQYAVVSLAAIAVLAGLLVWAPWKRSGAGGVTDKMKSLLTARAGPSAAGWTNSLGMKFVPVPGTEVLFSIWDTRVQDYQAFVTATGRSWEKPSFEQGLTHPAVNVSWDDAKAFCQWLTEKESREVARIFHRGNQEGLETVTRERAFRAFPAAIAS